MKKTTKIKALKSFVGRYGNATAGQVIEIEAEKAKKLIDLKLAEKTDEQPEPQTPPVPPAPPAGDE